MARSVYIASVEGASGKSTVALGVLELLVRRVGRVGVFRPIVRPGHARDYVLELLLDHDGVDVSYETAAGVTYDQVRADPDAALASIVERYHAASDGVDAIVVVGSDYTDVASPTEFTYNARIAVNLGTPVVLVLRGHGRDPAEIRAVADMAASGLAAQHGSLVALVANRVDPGRLDAVAGALSSAARDPSGDQVPAYAIPEEPFLVAPTVADLAAACDGTLLAGEPELLQRESNGVLIAAMTLPHVLERLVDGGVVVTPGDRSDLLIGLLAAHASATFPSLSGVVLSGGLVPDEPVASLIRGTEARLPIVLTDADTYETATRLAATTGRVSRDSPRKVEVARSLFAEHVADEALAGQLELSHSDVVTPLMFEYRVVDRARADRRRIVLPEGDEDRILHAADSLLRRDVADLTLLGDPAAITTKAGQLGLDISAATLIDPHDPELRERFAEEYALRRAHKGVTLDAARDVVVDVSYFGTMMVLLGLADGMVSGSVHTTAHTIRPAFEVVRTQPGVSVVSSVFFMCLPDRVLVYGDCAVNPVPTAPQLADIAISSADTAEQFGVEPRVAMLSYSTGASGTGAGVDKVREATDMVRERRPDLSVDGPIQYDAAIDASVAATKLPGSDVAGRATVFVFPDLNTGNNTYKAVQRSADAVAVGPVLQGLRRPVNDLSRGASVRDIVNTVAITAIQAATGDPDD